MTAVLASATLVAAGLVATATGVGGSPAPAGVPAVGLLVAVALWPAYAPHPARHWTRVRACAIGTGLTVGTLGLASATGVAWVPDPGVLVLAAATLLAGLPLVYASLRRRLGERQVVLAGDDLAKLHAVDGAIRRDDARGCRPIGYLSPSVASPELPAATPGVGTGLRTDGGTPRSDADTPLPAGDRQSVGGLGPGPVTRTDAAVGRGSGDRSPGGTDRVTAALPTRWVTVAGGGSDASRPDADSGSSGPGVRSDESPLPRGGPHRRPADEPPSSVPATDRIAGLSRLSHVLVERDVDVVGLGFATADREAFFGALRVCREHGVDAFVHRSHAAPVLVTADDAVESGAPARRPDRGGGPGTDRTGDEQVVAVDLEPLPWHARLWKRCFDVGFATVGLVVLAPVMAAIAVAVTLDSPGPVLYAQRRTGRLGETFDLLKFRSMSVDAEADSGARLSDEDAGGVDPRVTRVGRVLRRTHLDELPQLVSILAGDMSVVGPRPERPALDREIRRRGIDWERRWFLKPGLTGLAQIHDVNGFDPAAKLAWDLAYRERQSLATDVAIVATQIRIVLADAVAMVRGRAG